MSRPPPVTYDADRIPWGAPQRIPPSAWGATDATKKGRSSIPGAAGISEVRNDHHYATVTEFNVAVTTVSIKVLDQPTGLRNLLILRNASAADTLFIGFGREATNLSTLALNAGQAVLLDVVVPQDDLWCVSSGAAGSLSIAYSTIPEV